MADNIGNKPIVFFDGVCNLCNSIVQFIIRHDKKERFLFASLQSEKSKEILSNFNFTQSDIETIILLEENKLYFVSTAALKIVRHLNFLCSLLYIFIIIPKPLRNYVYRIIAKNRYKWFGKKDSCMVPSHELKNRFID
ncbi:MAG: thiol-disulfide oxidoreductase [Ignavibacteria bacterium GWB2_35_12]|nr:MAG: thiol-disulfide oxidoreductase [Ignavibacteria bacterium GWA2_35_8]OGU39304.1 MAG: thiol-disulfide oxidoreductase [Ignavibacteria bacterium GWB2_35_12]OGU92840.1 MAG: thiol-disulfide oxidoreductase [Ignavibacteria bacterium RIFOXYA2_FULL_35_10]OGV21187.1 MAG: thiol-disulfide oxidoreductase [Ignavibacteria bacterium RIFOXYC2_FULL_35_21]